MFLVEAMTTEGRISEAFATYEEAAGRVAAIPADALIGMALIFQELADGSQRIVREDGKPLQAHRPTLAEETGTPLPLADEDVPLGDLRAYFTPQDDVDPNRFVDPRGRTQRPDDDEAIPLNEPCD